MMSAPAYASDPQIQFLSQLLDEISDGHLLVPKFQRPVVWTDEQRLELMRSVEKSIPIGSMLVWRTRQKLASYKTLGPYRLRFEKGEFSSYLLDGHQRLSTLFGALKTPRQKELAETQDTEGVCWEILYDLEAEDFLLAEDAERDTVYVSLKVLLDSVESFRFQRSLIEKADAEELVRRFEELASAFQRYKIPIIPIVTDDLDQATFTFQRVNSQGTSMSQVHMIHALTWSENFDLNAKLEEIRADKLANLGWRDMDDTLVLTSCKATLGLDAFEGEIGIISRAFREQPHVLEQAVEHLVGGIRFLADRCGIGSPKLLPYGPLLPLLSEGIRLLPELDEEAVESLVYWFWWTAYVGLAGGSNASRMRKAAVNVRGVTKERRPVSELMPPVSELAPPPRRYDFRHARAKVLALRLAEKRAQVEKTDAALEELNKRGAEMVQPLVSRNMARGMEGEVNDRLDALLRGPANRILLAPEGVTQLRKDFMEGTVDENTKVRYLIPRCGPEDTHELEELLKQRQRALEVLEQEFAFKLKILDQPPRSSR